MSKKLLVLSAAALAAVSVTAQVQFAKPEDAIRYRQSAYFIMGTQMGNIAAQLKSDKPDLARIQRSASIVEFAFTLPGEGYVPGSEKGGNPPTKAKAEIFTSPKVREIAGEARQEIAKLNEAAKKGDLAAIRTQFQATAKSCDNCHDNFRNK
jgi:cytochrome c556